MTTTNSSDISIIRSLATRYDREQLESCLNQQIVNSANECHQDVDGNRIVNVLAKAGFVKQLMAQGMPIQEALRELGKRMRVFTINVNGN